MLLSERHDLEQSVNLKKQYQFPSASFLLDRGDLSMLKARKFVLLAAPRASRPPLPPCSRLTCCIMGTETRTPQWGTQPARGPRSRGRTTADGFVRRAPPRQAPLCLTPGRVVTNSGGDILSNASWCEDCRAVSNALANHSLHLCKKSDVLLYQSRNSL